MLLPQSRRVHTHTKKKCSLAQSSSKLTLSYKSHVLLLLVRRGGEIRPHIRAQISDASSLPPPHPSFVRINGVCVCVYLL